MPAIFSYDDFRDYLKAYHEERHQIHSWFSYRYMASKAGIDPGYFIKILQGKVPLSERFVEPIIALLGIKGREAIYFQELVNFSRARTQKQIQESYRKLLSLRDMELHTVTSKQFEYFTSWHYAAIRAATDILDFRDNYSLLAKSLSPPMSAKEAEAAVMLLERIGMIHRNEKGRWCSSQQFVSSGSHWKPTAIRAYQQEMFKLGMESLDRHAKELRDMSTLTVSMPIEELPELQARIAEFRKDLLKWVGSLNHENAVMQINLQVFPLCIQDHKT